MKLKYLYLRVRSIANVEKGGVQPIREFEKFIYRYVLKQISFILRLNYFDNSLNNDGPLNPSQIGSKDEINSKTQYTRS